MDGRASHQEIVTIQEYEAESSQGKSLWDPDFDVPAHGRPFFLPNEDKAKLTAHDEDHLRHDTLKLLGQAFILACVVDVKAQDRKALEDQKTKEIMELCEGMEHLHAEVN